MPWRNAMTYALCSRCARSQASHAYQDTPIDASLLVFAVLFSVNHAGKRLGCNADSWI